MKIPPGTQLDPAGAPDAEDAIEEERWVRCAACGARLAPERARIAVDGAHEHTFMNPSGLRFVIACFAVAPGCTGEGEASTVWTWFPGRAWRVATCASCRAHVGWSFERSLAGGARGEGDSFHGLVRDWVVR